MTKRSFYRKIGAALALGVASLAALVPVVNAAPTFSGTIGCSPSSNIRSAVTGQGTEHYHTLDSVGTVVKFFSNGNLRTSTQTFYKRAGTWHNSTSGTTHYGSASCTN